MQIRHTLIQMIRKVSINLTGSVSSKILKDEAYIFGIFVTLLEKFLKTEIRCNTCETYRWGQRPQRNEGHKVRAVFGQDRHQHNKIHVKLKRRSGHKRREESTCSDGKEAMMMRGEDQ